MWQVLATQRAQGTLEAGRCRVGCPKQGLQDNGTGGQGSWAGHRWSSKRGHSRAAMGMVKSRRLRSMATKGRGIGL